MVWTIERGRDILLWISVTDTFLEWLLRWGDDPVVTQMDPYGDVTLDENAQKGWLQTLHRVRAAVRDELRARHIGQTLLPRDPEARERILATLVGRDLEKDPHFKAAADLEALIELALENGAVIRVSGD